MIISDKIEVTISNQGSYYRNLGYGDLKQGDKIFVKINDLPTNSNKKVVCSCDMCHTTFERQYQLLKKNKKLYEEDLCNTCSRKTIGKKMDRTNIDLATKSRTGNKHPRWNDDKDELQSYGYKVRQASEKTYNENIDILNPKKHKRTLCGVENGYQLDHIISIKEGYERGVSVDEMSALNNLQLIPWKENRDKWF